MKFFKYWAKASAAVDVRGATWNVESYGSSNASPADAEASAQESARRTAEVFRSGDFPNSYLYSDRPVREEIIEEFGDDDDPYAVITRNTYGSLVLNTARVLFADIDDPDQSSESNPLKPLLGLLGKFLGTEELTEEIVGESDDDIPTSVAEFVDSSPGLGLRLYRTAAGYRCLVTSREYDPLAGDSQLLLSELGSDPLYVRLCEVQECFRARLTPKFWRCGVGRPPVRFPWADASQVQAMRDWEREYSRSIENFATCELVESLGSSIVLPQIEPMVDLHDRLCCRADRPLA